MYINNVMRYISVNNFDPSVPILVKDDILRQKYSDRWNKISDFFKLFPPSDILPNCDLPSWQEDIGYKFNAHYSQHDYVNLAYDICTLNGDQPAIDYKTCIQQPHVLRTKLNVTDKSIINYRQCKKSEEFEYFVQMKLDFDEVLLYYYNNLYPKSIREQYDFFTCLMAIRYTSMSAKDGNDSDIAKFGTNLWGVQHSDDTLGGLHLGEDVKEFHALYNNEYKSFDELSDNHTLFFFGQDAEKHGILPTIHGMVPHPNIVSTVRHSIIINLETVSK